MNPLRHRSLARCTCQDLKQSGSFLWLGQQSAMQRCASPCVFCFGHGGILAQQPGQEHGVPSRSRHMQRHLLSHVGHRHRQPTCDQCFHEAFAFVIPEEAGIATAEDMQQAISRPGHCAADQAVVPHLPKECQCELRPAHVQGLLESLEEREALLQKEICDTEPSFLHGLPEIATLHQLEAALLQKGALSRQTLLEEHNSEVTVFGLKGARKGILPMRVGGVEIGLALHKKLDADGGAAGSSIEQRRNPIFVW
mmetsp:Transcript_40413/g.86071  ORF Transcript_40413/g.86071 Transcript_40413/m.86071 type:complete len:253 (+) Transcript_40413:2258-3016(+)